MKFEPIRVIMAAAVVGLLALFAVTCANPRPAHPAPRKDCWAADTVSDTLRAEGYEMDEGFYGRFGAWEIWRAGKHKRALVMRDESGCGVIAGRGVGVSTEIRR